MFRLRQVRRVRLERRVLFVSQIGTIAFVLSYLCSSVLCVPSVSVSPVLRVRSRCRVRSRETDVRLVPVLVLRAVLSYTFYTSVAAAPSRGAHTAHPLLSHFFMSRRPARHSHKLSDPTSKNLFC